MSDWESSDSDSATKANSAPSKVPVVPKAPVKSKWEGEDEDNNDVASDWEASSDEEEKPQPTATTLPPKKKGNWQAKSAERVVEKATRPAGKEDLYDEDAVLDPRERARRDRERELNADLANAADLFGVSKLSDIDAITPAKPAGSAAPNKGTGSGSGNPDLDKLLALDPRTKDEFAAFSRRLIDVFVRRHQGKPLYAAFVEAHVRELATPLKDVEVRKAATALTTLANEKQKEARDKASGKKKPKTAGKPTLGSVKASSRLDTTVYDESLDDFGKEGDDFM